MYQIANKINHTEIPSKQTHLNVKKKYNLRVPNIYNKPPKYYEYLIIPKRHRFRHMPPSKIHLP